MEQDKKKRNLIRTNLEPFALYHQLEQKEIPACMPTMENRWTADFDTSISYFALREYVTKQLGFAFVSYDWVRPLAKWIGNRSVLEVLSGKGALSHALQTCGVDILPTDNYTWFPVYHKKDMWTDVENIDALDAINKYGSKRDILLMSWIPYQSNIGTKALQHYHEVNPNGLVIVIGEGPHGCTADDSFFEHFDEIQDEDFLEAVQNFESWDGIHDYPALGRYKS